MNARMDRGGMGNMHLARLCTRVIRIRLISAS